MTQVLSLIGAALVLSGFVGLQTGRLEVATVTYQATNLAGSIVLAITGFLASTWGFVVLNVVWAAFAAYKLLQLSRPAAP